MVEIIYSIEKINGLKGDIMSIFNKQNVAAERIGKNLHELRHAQGLSRNAIADKTRLPREYIKQLEYGFTEASREELKRLAKALNSTPTELTSPDSLIIEIDGTLIRTLRKANGEKQGALAKAVNVPIRTVGDWELNKRPIPIGTLHEMAEHFDVPYEAFIDGDIDEYLDNNKAEELYDLAKSATNDEIDYIMGILRFEMSKRGF